MEQRNGNVWFFRLHILQDLLDPVPVDFLVFRGIVGIEQIHQILIAGRHAAAAQALGEGHKGNLDTLDFRNGIALGGAQFRCGGIGAQRLDTGAADGI